MNIQIKTAQHNGKFKSVRVESFDDSCIFYIIKVDNELKNSVADEKKMMIYNFKEGVMCPFNKEKADLYENFHHYHDQ
jgi:anoctamin-10